MKFLKGSGVVFAALFFGLWLYTRLTWPSTVTDAPEILANLYAKELCTCRYVVGLGSERCLAERKMLMRPSRVDWNDGDQSLRVRVLWATSSARRVSERFGCARAPSVH
jgi:hypothetical protein